MKGDTITKTVVFLQFAPQAGRIVMKTSLSVLGCERHFRSPIAENLGNCQDCGAPLASGRGDHLANHTCRNCLEPHVTGRSNGFAGLVLLSLALALLAIAAMIRPAFSADTPMRLQAFCVRYLDQCGEKSGRAPTLAEIAEINAAVNRSMKWVPEKTDVWRINVRRGDCEDFALTKRDRLIARGIGTRHLALRLVDTPSGQRHLTLIARAADGRWYELDNSARYHARTLRPLAASPYPDLFLIAGNLRTRLR